MTIIRRLLLAALLCVSTASQAQYVSSTHDRLTTPGEPQSQDVLRGNELFREMARCVVDRQTTRVENLLRSPPGSDAEASLAYSLQSRYDQCMGMGSISVPYYVLRGGLAEVLYHRKFPNGLDTTTKPASDVTLAWSDPHLNSGGDQALELMHSAARCLVARQPKRVSDLLATETMTPEEMRVIRDLQGDLGACLFQGITFNGNRQSMRALLAEAALEYGLGQRNGFAGVASASAG
jgi:hypothetical protein